MVADENAAAEKRPASSATTTIPEASEQAAPAANRPTLADGVQLIGEYEGSGYKEAPSLVRRPDGQVIQLPPLLYSVAAKADGRRTEDEIATAVSAEVRRGIDASQIRYVVEEKLRPLGVLAAADGSSPSMAKADPFLGLKLRFGMISERTSNALGSAFKPLFLPPVVLAVLVAFVLGDIWLFLGHGIAQGLRQSLYNPGVFLPLFGAVVASAALHEIGHAAACRYGGGRPGKMGCGLYLAWPAFYTDVTDAYRLGRRARLRTDLGGVYFNIIVVLATLGAYAVTRFEPLLLLAVIQHFEIADQLLPVVRLDGYYIVADLTGVPDLFARIGPILRSIVPGQKADERVIVLKPWVRVAVTAWVLIVVPLLVFELLIVLLHLPRILGTGWDSANQQFDAATNAFSAGNPVAGLSGALQLIVLAIPIVGILLVLAKTGAGAATVLWTRTDGRPITRTGMVLVAAVGCSLLAMAWVPQENYRPIQPGERGTVTEGIAAVRQLPAAGPLYSERQALKQADVPPTTEPSASSDTSTTLATAEATTTTIARAGGTPETSSSTTSTSSTTTTTVVGTTTTGPSPSTTTPAF